MYVVKTSARALLVALIPLVAIHAVLFATALLETQVTPPLWTLPPPDTVFLIYCRLLGLDAALLFAGHLLLRRGGISSRMAYALTGGGMVSAAYAVALQNGWLLSPPQAGTEVTMGLLPSLTGMIAGFLYGQFAGLEPIGELSARAAPRFEGPVRVRTSVAAIAVAATVPAVLSGILSFAFSWLFFTDAMVPGSRTIFVTALPAQLFLVILIVTVVPAAIVVLATHHVVRACGARSGVAYALAGAVLAGLCSLLITPFWPFLPVRYIALLMILYGAVMGAMYRRFAGLEPVPLPEPVIATDPDALVGADHSSRRSHAVIIGQ